MQLEFFGAAGEVTGSCHILRVGGATLLLDCGLIQGGERPHLRNLGAGFARHIVFCGDVGQYESPILRDPQTLRRYQWILR